MLEENINKKPDDDSTDKQIDDILLEKIKLSINAQGGGATSEDNYSEEESFNKINYYVQTANAKILLNTLAPEVSQNEEKKREHKDKLIKYVSIFLGAQFGIIFILVMVFMISNIVFHAIGNDFSQKQSEMLFAFFGAYVTSVIVELVYILKYIVVSVFDTSISALMEIFKAHEDKNKD